MALRSALLALLVACGGSSPRAIEPQPESIRTTPPAESHRFSGLSIGSHDGCILEGSTAICWGSFFGSDARPRVLSQLGEVSRIAIRSGTTACGLRTDGELHCFGGYDQEARLQRAEELYEEQDDPDLSDERNAEILEELELVESDTTPVRVATNVRDFLVYDGGGCHLSGDTLRCWDELAEEGGVVPERTLETEGEIVQLASSTMHRCLLQADGRVRCWGFGMGLGWTPEGQAEDPERYEEGRQPGLAPARDAVQVAAGEEFTCIRRSNGTVACWGLVSDWFSTEHDHELRVEQIEIPGIDDATAIAAGDTHACAIVEGRVTCWGSNTFGQLGTGDARRVLAPVEIEALSPAREIALGTEATCALVGEEIRCVGSNRYGAFGFSQPSEPVLFPERGSRVHTTSARTCVETDDGLACTSTASRRPVHESTQITRRVGPVDQLVGTTTYECTRRGATVECGDGHVTLSGVRQVVVGRSTACSVMTDGHVRCWSLPRQRPDLINSAEVPTLIDGLDRVESIDVADGVACVVRNGRVLCWGARSHSIPLAESTTPVELEGVRDVVQVSAHSFSICVRKRDQTVSCRSSGEWSDVELANVVQMETFAGYSRLLLTSNHRVHQLSYGTRLVELPAEITSLSASSFHACAHSRDGRVWCWGDGSHGQLGTLPNWVHFTPVVVALDHD